MAIGQYIRDVNLLLDRVHKYDHIIQEDSLEEATVEDMAGNAKAICDEAKGKIDSIKDDIESWS